MNSAICMTVIPMYAGWGRTTFLRRVISERSIPEEYRSLIVDALSEYESNNIPEYDLELAVKYAEYMIKSIREPSR